MTAAILQSLHDAASERTGLSDFGDDRYREGLEILLAAYDENPYFNEVGRRAALDSVVTALIGRLESQRGWKHDSRWSETRIEQPLFVLGLPRTGTTALHKLLAEDPASQSLPHWLGVHPEPRPPLSTWDSHPAYRETKARLDALYERSPGMRAAHDMQADEPDECRLLRMQSFADFTFDTSYVPRYRAWLMDLDQREVYARYRDNLRMIGAGDGRRWVLKCPGHLWALDALLHHFPDACVIQTHRAPEQVIPSGCSLRFAASKALEPELPPETIGRDNVERWHTILERAFEVRRRTDPARFYDLDFRAFVRDPIAEIERIYSYFSIPLSQRARAAMQSRHAARPRHQHGEHRYQAASFGLSDDGLRARFADYRARYGLD